jgi:hypothetical protein
MIPLKGVPRISYLAPLSGIWLHGGKHNFHSAQPLAGPSHYVALSVCVLSHNGEGEGEGGYLLSQGGEVPDSAQKCPKVSESARNCPKLPETARNCTKVPETARKCPKILGDI